MKTAWAITTYLKSKHPLTSRVVPVISVDCVFVCDEPPSKVAVEAFIALHIRNCELLLSEVTRTEIPSEFEIG